MKKYLEKINADIISWEKVFDRSADHKQCNIPWLLSLIFKGYSLLLLYKRECDEVLFDKPTLSDFLCVVSKWLWITVVSCLRTVECFSQNILYKSIYQRSGTAKLGNQLNLLAVVNSEQKSMKTTIVTYTPNKSNVRIHWEVISQTISDVSILTEDCYFDDILLNLIFIVK